MLWRPLEVFQCLLISVGRVSNTCRCASPTEAPRKSSDPKSFTLEEVAKHNTREDLWIIVEGKAYDVTKYVQHHPGGWLPMVNMAGKDCTDVFANYHPARVYEKMLPGYYVGEVSDYEVSDFVQEHREVRQKLLERGLFETRLSFYAYHVAFQAALFSCVLYGVLCCSTYSAHMLAAGVLGFFWQQVAGIGHDIGHNAVFHQMKKDNLGGLVVGPLLTGISIAWWKRSHNVHHIVCNSVENDPDIQFLPLFAITEKMFGKFWSTYHQKWFTTDAVAKLLVRYQHFLFYPVMAVARFNLYVQSWALLFSKDRIYNRKQEMACMLLFIGWNAALLSQLPSDERLRFLLLSHAVAGVLHVQICLSHFSMGTYNGHAYNDESDEWFKMQCATTLNIATPPLFDFVHIGLQHQIEHHLFPRLPRHNLREARKYVKPLCEKHGIVYHEPGFFQANVELVRTLYRTAQLSKNLKQADGGFYESPLWEGLNAQG
ncbi:hypothetical protein CYMTET_15490 [Cymbomonas tetramitiformis]|uniref:Cytochrome b5 heme-binding domain-containing protein n=1 Tax=Cymbomonas tetramitiformis TaxID=36881 RepID=A0AAE0L9A4_9CHLO|nr:hypothetical protein CYMTET_15490 [Cymbomonas tetramitiformis]